CCGRSSPSHLTLPYGRRNRGEKASSNSAKGSASPQSPGILYGSQTFPKPRMLLSMHSNLTHAPRICCNVGGLGGRLYMRSNWKVLAVAWMPTLKEKKSFGLCETIVF